MTEMDIAEEWIVRAEKDIKAARNLTTHYPIHYELIAYISHETAEKALKGILCYNNQRIEKTHDLEKLLQQCEQFDKEITNRFETQIKELTDYSFNIRCENSATLDYRKTYKIIEIAEGILEHAKDYLVEKTGKNGSEE